ncbi:hypothetical protein BJ508DRAFT_415846 [Ascobolus immersus RN42]|uniref:F-box domain-containing protein n=1 Tax=Ascobolus immersus RN42 TaxID=1160509 RepID=A0A3N4I4F4_ASCIM|nr:hypothetical protein BJ508DRAFT_415846 [Ascobolus immersus RN42]
MPSIITSSGWNPYAQKYNQPIQPPDSTSKITPTSFPNTSNTEVTKPDLSAIATPPKQSPRSLTLASLPPEILLQILTNLPSLRTLSVVLRTSPHLYQLVHAHPHTILAPLARKTYPTPALDVLNLSRLSSASLFAPELAHRLTNEPYGLRIGDASLNPSRDYIGFPELKALSKMRKQVMELTSFVRQGCNHLRSPTILTPEETKKVHHAIYELYRLLPSSVLYFSEGNVLEVDSSTSDVLFPQREAQSRSSSPAPEARKPTRITILPESVNGFTINYAPAMHLDLHILFTIIGIYTRLQQLRNDWGVLGQLCGKLQHFLSERCLGFDGVAPAGAGVVAGMTASQRRIRTGEIMGLARGCVLREFGEGVEGVCRDVEARENMRMAMGGDGLAGAGFVELEVEGYGRILVRRSCVRLLD